MDKNKKDYLVKNLCFQTVVCIMLFVMLFGFKQTNNSFFNDVKELLAIKLSENITFKEAVDVFNSFKDTVNPIYEEKSEEDASSQDASEEETVFVPFEEPSLSAEIKAEGGSDVTVKSKNDIPSNVSIAPYNLNQKMIMPVINGRTTSQFGVRNHPISGDLRFHAGIDIAAPLGTQIYSAFDGSVYEADYDRWNGNYIKIKHDNGIMTVYCHCEKLNVKKGQVLRAGEVIATVGSTGSSTGPHLHFELRIDNISYNPESALKTAISAV